ncbi:MAG: glycosyltransferase family 4 protein [Nitrososphaeria archaeon]
MKIYLVTPMDLKYSYRATEYYIYEYAKYLKDNGKDVEILVTKKPNEKYTLILNYRKTIRPYRKIKQKPVQCKLYTIPLLKWHFFFYKNLPKDGVIYLPFTVYDYVFNILTKPRGQKYVIGSHSLDLKKGHILEGHEFVEKLVNSVVKSIFLLIGKEKKNIFFHVINTEQAKYIKKYFKYPNSNIFYAPNFIEMEKYKLGENKSKKLKVIHIGGIDKEADIVFDIIKLLDKKGQLNNFDFYFVGNAPDLERYEITEPENIHILGKISELEKLKLLSSSDCIIIPAYESFSKTLLEGIASGLYILTSKKNAAWKDFKKAGIKMFVSENGKAEDYLKILNNLAKQKQKGEKARRYKIHNIEILKKNYTKTKVLPKIFDMFEKVKR